MLAFALGLLLLAAPAAAQSVSTETFSIAGAGLTREDVSEIIEEGAGRYVAVGDRLVDVASSTAAGADVALTRPEGEALARAADRTRVARLRTAAAEGR
ncbi:MAG: hypothetical protein KGL74_11705, partial [Elusimicrobia bacterium]|nr:hypothetical protein [Elusimicrobiota bacterium]